MSQEGPLPLLFFNGVEVANGARTIEYLRAGLGGTDKWVIGDGDMCDVLYSDAGVTSGGGTIDTNPPPVFSLMSVELASFDDPSTDPAPWYDSSEPGSATFLGIILLGLTGYDSTHRRERASRGRLGGGTFGAKQHDVRLWKFHGALISSDDAGAEFGYRWLNHILQTADCDTCGTGYLTVRLVCPPEDDLTLGEWTSYDVALVEGPHEVEQFAPRPASLRGTLAGCRDIVEYEWTLAAGNPFLYKRPIECLEEVILGVDGECSSFPSTYGGFYYGGGYYAGDVIGGEGEEILPVCCPVEPPARGTLGAIFTLRSVSGMGPVMLEAYPECPGSGTAAAERMLMLSSVPPGSTVVVDSARHVVTITVDGVTTDGQHLIEPPPGQVLRWIEVRDCDDLLCVCARPLDPCSGGLDTTVAISTQIREG